MIHNKYKFDTQFLVDKKTGRLRVELKLSGSDLTESALIEVEKHRKKMQFIYDLLMKNIVDVENKSRSSSYNIPEPKFGPNFAKDTIFQQISKDPNPITKDKNLKAYHQFKDFSIEKL